MGTIKPVACLILTLILAAAAAAQQSTKPTHQQTSDSGSEAQNGSVRGRVVLPSGAQVSEPVKVSLQTLRGVETFIYTDLQGAFEMRNIEPGDYTLEVEADRQQRFETVTERILVQRGTPSVVTIYLKEKKSAEDSKDSKSAAAVVSAGELDGKVPVAAVKEFDRAGKAAKEGKAAEAIEHFRRAISIYPDYLKAHNDLGTQLMGLGKLDEAEEEFRRAIKIGTRVPPGRRAGRLERRGPVRRPRPGDRPGRRPHARPRGAGLHGPGQPGEGREGVEVRIRTRGK